MAPSLNLAQQKPEPEYIETGEVVQGFQPYQASREADEVVEGFTPIGSALTNRRPEIAEYLGTPGGFKGVPDKESISAMKSTVKTGVPMIADIIATALMPQKAIPTAMKWGPKLGYGLLNAFSRAGGSAIGSSAGSLLSDVLFGDKPDWERANEQGALGIIGELGTSGIGAAIKGGSELGKKGIDIVGEMTKAGKVATRHANRYLQGEQDKLVSKTTENVLDFFRATSTQNKENVGFALGESLNKMRDFDSVYAEPNAIIQMAAKGGKNQVPLKDAYDLFNELVDSYMGYNQFKRRDKGVKAAGEWLGLSDNKDAMRILGEFDKNAGELSPSNAQYLLKQLWKKHNIKTPEPDSVIEWKLAFKDRVKGDISRQVDNAIDYPALLEKSDKMYAETMQWFDKNPAAKAIVAKLDFGKSNTLYYQGQQAKAFDKILSAPANEIVEIRKAVMQQPGGPEAWAGLELIVTRDLYRKALFEEGGSGSYMFAPGKFADLVLGDVQDSITREKIKAISPRLWINLKAEAEKYAALAPKFKTIDANNGYDLFEAWGLQHPEAKKLLGKVARVGGIVSKQAGKAATHWLGEEAGYGEAKP